MTRQSIIAVIYPHRVHDVSVDFLLIFSTSTYLVWSGLASIWFLSLIALAFIKFLFTRGVSVPDPFGKHIGTILFIALGTVLVFPTGFTASWATSVASCYIVVTMAYFFWKDEAIDYV